MERGIEVRFISDGIVTEAEKLPYIRYINRVLSRLAKDIIYDRGHVNVVSKKGFAQITFTSTNDILNKRVTLKLLDAPVFER